MDHPLHSEKRSDNTQDFTILNIGHALAHTQVIATLERGHLPENLGPYTTNYEYPIFWVSGVGDYIREWAAAQRAGGKPMGAGPLA